MSKLPGCFQNPSFEPNLLDPRMENHPSAIQEKMGPILFTAPQVIHELSLLCALWAKRSLKCCASMHLSRSQKCANRKRLEFPAAGLQLPAIARRSRPASPLLHNSINALLYGQVIRNVLRGAR